MGKSNRNCSYQASNEASGDKITESMLWGDLQVEGAMWDPCGENVGNGQWYEFNEQLKDNT